MKQKGFFFFFAQQQSRNKRKKKAVCMVCWYDMQSYIILSLTNVKSLEGFIHQSQKKLKVKYMRKNIQDKIVRKCDVDP